VLYFRDYVVALINLKWLWPFHCGSVKKTETNDDEPVSVIGVSAAPLSFQTYIWSTISHTWYGAPSSTIRISGKPVSVIRVAGRPSSTTRISFFFKKLIAIHLTSVRYFIQSKCILKGSQKLTTKPYPERKETISHPHSLFKKIALICVQLHMLTKKQREPVEWQFKHLSSMKFDLYFSFNFNRKQFFLIKGDSGLRWIPPLFQRKFTQYAEAVWTSHCVVGTRGSDLVKQESRWEVPGCHIMKLQNNWR
jgi:hypothetical protein